MGDTYDYIICGGGTCGPVIARRLSDEKSLKILLLEAGSHSKDMHNVHMPGAWTKNHYGPTDWQIETPGQPGLNGRQCKLPRGRFLGGSSGSNGTICVRGVKDDYNDWGFDEWNGEEMFRAMRKAETFHPKKWFPHDEKAHGWDGPLHIEPAPPPFPLAERMFESFQSKGMPYDADMFSHGNTVQGCGHTMRTTYQGYRATAADYVTKDQERPNVEIRCDVTVDKVILEKGSDGLLEAKGAEYVDASGNRIKVFASREVIITAGTYCSPAVLMRSGIGPKAELEALDIPVRLDLPGVGENLQDHQLMWTYYEVSDPTLTDDARMNHDPDAYNTAHKEWLDSKSGFMAVFPFGAFGFARLSDRLDKENSPAGEEWRSFPREEGRDPMSLTKNQPNLEFFNTVGYGGPPEYTDFPKEGQYAFGMCCFLCGLKGRGKVTIKTKDPFAPPFVNPRYLEDRRDLLMMTEGVRFANEIVMEGAGTKNVVKGAWPPGAKHHLNKTNEDWQPFVRERCSTSYHPGGTAKLGKKDDPMAVVDKYLFVYGTKNLRVADCSIMPTLNSGHTQMPAYGIAEKAAEYILQAAGSKAGAQGAGA